MRSGYYFPNQPKSYDGFAIRAYPDGRTGWLNEDEYAKNRPPVSLFRPNESDCKNLRDNFKYSPKWLSLSRLKYFRETGQIPNGGIGMDEFKKYVSEYKDWIFTVLIIVVVDHFFLNGALKEKLAAALGKKLDTNTGGANGAAQQQ